MSFQSDSALTQMVRIANQMLLLMLRERDSPINQNITSLITNARSEMLLAREAGNKDLENFWRMVMDRFLDNYARNRQPQNASE